MSIIDDNDTAAREQSQPQPEAETKKAGPTYEVDFEAQTLTVRLPSGLAFTMPLFSRPLAGAKES